MSKNTNDGGSIYVIGKNVIYNITAACNPGGSTGNLYLTDGSLIDNLPPQLTYVSATPAPSSVSGQTVAWNYLSTGSLPKGCSADGSGTTSYTLTATLNAGTPADTVVDNSVTFTGDPLGAAPPQSTTADKKITAVATSPQPSGDFLGKSSLGPLNIPGLGFHGTYAGHWFTSINPAPNPSSPGAAEGSYTVTVNYTTSRAFETDLLDPVPCLVPTPPPISAVYASSTVTGPLSSSGSPSIDRLCTAPAFNPTVVRVNSASLATAVNPPDGWRPDAILTDGTSVNLTLHGGAGTSTYFEVPVADLGKVAAIELPRDINLTDVTMSMNVWGYADDSFGGGEVLHDIASATAYPTVGSDVPNTESDTADLYLQPSYPQLGAFKSFGAYGAAPSSTTALNLQGTLALTSPPDRNVVLTDLLPYGLSWHNPVSSAQFSLSAQQGGTSTPVTGTVTDTPNFQATGRELIRVSFSPSAFSTGFYTITAPTNFVELNVPVGAATYDNTDQLFINGSGDAPRSSCGPGSGQTPSTFESSDPLDLDGDGASQQNYCQYAASLVVPPPTGSSFRLVKTVQGDLDSAPKYSPGIGNASEGGSAVYTLNWSNTGSTTLNSPVVYDIFPYIGDTGVSQGQAGTPRGSQFTTIFAGVSGTLPSGVSVAYSESTNPCRPEVFPDAANPGCVNDWGSAPADLSLVKAIRITSTNTYATRQAFAVSVKVNVPLQYVNVVAWNSAATDARFGTTALPPSEPPRVGLTAPAPPATPTVATTASAPDVQPGDGITDTVTVGATGGGSGSLAWTLLGPIPAAPDGTCTGLDWSGATTLDSGTLAVSGNGSYTTPTSTPIHAGCYTYVQSLTGSGFSGPVSTAPGDAGETVLVHPAQLSTTASAVRILPGGQVNDSVVVSGRGVGAGTLDWTLVGPIAPAPDGTCEGLDWSGAGTADQGTIEVTGDGTYATDASSPTAIGCYSYVQRLTDDSVGGPATTAAGDPGETVLVAKPDLSTSISSASLQKGGAVSDEITVGGTGGAAGSLAWTLVGPVAPVSGSCADADWSGAATADQGTIAVDGDGTFVTPASPVPAAGCYGYAVTLTGGTYGGAVTSPAGARGEVALVTSPAPPPPPPPPPSPPPSAAQPVHVTIVKHVTSKTTTLGHDLTYRLVASNSGPGTAGNVQIIDTPGSKLRLVSVKPSSGSCGHGFPLTCNIGRLSSGSQATVIVVARPLEVGSITNTAHVTTPETNTASPGQVLSTVRSRVRASLVLTKTAAQRSVKAGARVRYTIVVRNPTAAMVPGLKVCDRLPSGLVFASASVHMTLRNGIRCATFRQITPRRELSFTLVARALGGAAGQLANRATLSGVNLVTRSAVSEVSVIRRPARGGGVTG